jgi:hypothetical protein
MPLQFSYPSALGLNDSKRANPAPDPDTLASVFYSIRPLLGPDRVRCPQRVPI